MKIDTKKVGKFLKSVNDAEYLYMERCMSMRNGITNLIKRHNLSKQDFCKRFKIKSAKYNDYITGNHNYSVKDMACLNAAFLELEAKKLEEEVPIQVANSTDK